MDIKRPIHSLGVGFNSIVHALETQGRVLNPESEIYVDGIFVWDTGATFSAINSSLIKHLNLKEVGYMDLMTANGLVRAKRRVAKIVLPKELSFNWQVSCLKLSENILGLIGMDIIRLGSFLVQNKGNKTVFQYSIPYLEVLSGIDFVDLAINENQKNKKKLQEKNPNHPMLRQYDTEK